MRRNKILLSLALVAGLAACSKDNGVTVAEEQVVMEPERNVAEFTLVSEHDTEEGISVTSQEMIQAGNEDKELMCLADSEEEAKKIADQYGIELKEYENGVAVFHSDEDPMEVIKRGKENGWPLLEINTTVTLDAG